LTNLHGGSIWAESEFGKGTRMTVQLRMGHAHFDPTILDRRQTEEAVSHGRRNDDTGMPQWSARFEMQNEYKYQAIDEATERRLAPRDHGIAAEEAQARILVVEDSRDMLQFIHLQLTDAYTVYLAEHGKRGLELVRKLKPDLVVTDYMMPEMDGIELTKFIKEDRTTAHIPVVMLTAKAGVQDRVAGREAGADEYLAKPFRTSELMAVIKAQLKASENEADRIVSHRMDSVEILAGRLAHEIHNPLNYLKNGAFLIGRSVDRLNEAYSDQDTKKQEKAVTSIHRLIEQINVGAERISGTVDMLKEYAREGYSPEIREYSVNDGIRAVMDVVRPTDGILRDIIFTPDDTAGSLQCVPQEFHEIVSNLIQNAMDATMDDAQISVRAVDDEDRVLIEVQDNGSGMPPEVVEKVFSPFFTTKEPGRGMGMGLTIVYRLVKRAGGRIDVFSEEGEGTRFSVRLPRQQNTGSA
jgi:signal transduction histidine kinase